MALSPHDIPKMFGDVPPFMAVPYLPDLSQVKADAIVLGMPYDGIATYRGGATRRAPQEIRKYSLLFGDYNLDWDLDVFAHIKAADAGDIDVVPGNTPESYARLERRIAEIQRQARSPSCSAVTMASLIRRSEPWRRIAAGPWGSSSSIRTWICPKASARTA